MHGDDDRSSIKPDLATDLIFHNLWTLFHIHPTGWSVYLMMRDLQQIVNTLMGSYMRGIHLCKSRPSSWAQSHLLNSILCIYLSEQKTSRSHLSMNTK